MPASIHILCHPSKIKPEALNAQKYKKILLGQNSMNENGKRFFINNNNNRVTAHVAPHTHYYYYYYSAIICVCLCVFKKENVEMINDFHHLL